MVGTTAAVRAAAPVEVLAIIPARGGSKSIPRKNVKTLGGVPLIAYSIAAAQQAETVTRLIVTTDDEEIARVAESFNAEVPFMRPAELARDDTTDLPVFQHALRWLEKYEGYQPEVVVQLRPTSPLRPRYCVDAAVRALLGDPRSDSVRAVVTSGQNPYKMWRPAPGGLMQPLLTHESAEPYNEPRQRLPPTYWQTGHVDAARYDTVMRRHSMNGDAIRPLLIDQAYVADIDTPFDWERAEWLLSRGALDVVRPVEGGSYHEDSPARADGESHLRGNGEVPRDGAAAVWQSEEVRRRLARVRLLALDFDGVMTDNRVLVRQDGTESVWCDRADGLGLALLRDRGLEAVVLSTETNPCVTARARKLGLECVQGCEVKLDVLRRVAAERNLGPDEVAFVGNDLNDLECLRWAGLPIAVADANAEVRAAARVVTMRAGGRGAVREVTDALVAHGRLALALRPRAVAERLQQSQAEPMPA